MFKTIIPELVSIDTDLNSLNGFIMCQDFNFYPNTANKNKYHYKLKQENTIIVPEDYDFRSEYYVKKGNVWYYERNTLFWRPSFKYDTESKTLFYNRDYLLLPFSLGGIFTLGEHLSNLIDLDLFLNDHVILRGIAYKKDGKNICISAPGFNGKTTYLKKMLKEGANYIAEDYLVIDVKSFRTYPTCPLKSENIWRRRKINKELSVLIKKKPIINKSVFVDKLLLVENSQNQGHKPPRRKIIDCLLLNSLFFMNNLFIKSIIYDKGLTLELLKKITEAGKNMQMVEFIHTQNYNYSSLKNK